MGDISAACIDLKCTKKLFFLTGHLMITSLYEGHHSSLKILHCVAYIINVHEKASVLVLVDSNIIIAKHQ